MTVPAQTPIISYSGNGVTSGPFAFPFRILVADDLKVTLDGQATTAYMIAGLGDDQGSITFSSAPAVGASIIIYRDVALERDTDYQFNGDFRAVTINADLDRLWMAIQDIGAGENRAIRYPVEEYALDGTLPSPLVRAGNVLGFDANGTLTFYPIPPMVGAGDLRTDVFSASMDFTAGSTTSLSLSRAPGSVANVQVHFDGVYQGPDQIQSLVGNVITFISPIPDVSKVYVTSGTTLSVDTITAGSVRLAANGIDDTLNFQLACLTAQEIELVGTGPFFIGPVTIPSSVKSIFSKSGAIVKPNGHVPTGAGFSTWITASGLSDANIKGIEFKAPSATYGGLTVLLLSGCSYTTVERVKTNGSGYTGISSALGIGNRILKCRTIDWKGNGIQVSGSSLAALDLGTEVAGCYSEGNGVSSVAHGISFIYALDFNCHHNRAKAAGTFGFEAALCEGGIFDANQSYNSIHEGLNVEDSNHVKTIGNTARWDAGGGPGIDFGMSFFGNTRNCVGLEVIGNKVVNSASSGIAFAGSASFGVQHSPVRDNFIFNCNAKQAAVAGGVDNLAGIMLSASLTQANPIAGNTVYDGINTLTYGIAELNFGTGSPTSNEITSNRLGGSAGALLIHITNASTKTARNTPQL